MATITAISTTPKVRYNAGTSSTGATVTKTMTVFSSSLAKASYDNTAYSALLTVVGLLESCMARTIAGVECSTTSSVSA